MDREGHATNIALAYMAGEEYRVSSVVTQMSYTIGLTEYLSAKKYNFNFKSLFGFDWPGRWNTDFRHIANAMPLGTILTTK